MEFLLGQTWLVLMVPVEYTGQAFMASLKIFSLASTILNQHVA
jgi:hypothetical protein